MIYFQKLICFILIKILALGFVQAQISEYLNFSQLEENFKNEVSQFNYEENKHRFVSKLDYQRIVSQNIIQEFQKILKRIFLEKEIISITAVKCHNATEAYSTWYLAVEDEQGKNHYYKYQDNLGIRTISLVGITDKYNFLNKLSTDILNIRSEVNQDYMVLLEIYNENIEYISYSQCFHILDISFFNYSYEILKNKEP